MSELGIFLDYTGHVDFEKTDSLLRKLKDTQAFLGLQKTTGKRVYAIVAECLENISRYSIKEYPVDSKLQPFISGEIWNEKIAVRTGNPIEKDKAEQLAERLRYINQLDEDALTLLYEKIMNKETLNDENGAGLGFIIVRLKSGNKIEFSFTGVSQDISFFFMEISINKYIMRKLIIDRTASSPRVILDPDKNMFEISGESRPPDVGNFYTEILKWMDDYSKHLLRSSEVMDPVVFNLDFEYFNSSSAKYILDFCKQIASFRSKGKDMTVKWHYEEDDMDMLEVGKEMSRMAKIPFEFIQKS